MNFKEKGRKLEKRKQKGGGGGGGGGERIESRKLAQKTSEEGRKII